MTRLAVRTTDYTDREMGGMAGQEFLYKDLTYAIPSTLRQPFDGAQGKAQYKRQAQDRFHELARKREEISENLS